MVYRIEHERAPEPQTDGHVYLYVPNGNPTQAVPLVVLYHYESADEYGNPLLVTALGLPQD